MPKISIFWKKKRKKKEKKKKKREALLNIEAQTIFLFFIFKNNGKN